MTLKAKAAALLAAAALISSEMIYPDALMVKDIEDTENPQEWKVICETSTGIEYAYYGDGDIMPGDIMAVLMFSNGTKTAVDDEIIAVRYTGFWAK